MYMLNVLFAQVFTAREQVGCADVTHDSVIKHTDAACRRPEPSSQPGLVTVLNEKRFPDYVQPDQYRISNVTVKTSRADSVFPTCFEAGALEVAQVYPRF